MPELRTRTRFQGRLLARVSPRKTFVQGTSAYLHACRDEGSPSCLHACQRLASNSC